MRYLTRECPECGNPVHITVNEAGVIIEYQGCEPRRIGWLRRPYKGTIMVNAKPSNKVVTCTAKTRIHMDGISQCYHQMLVSKFTEIVL